MNLGSFNDEVFSIAVDGGFGPMRDEMAEIGSIDTDENLHTFGESEAEDDQGEDFDDFEAGAADADFGEFDDEFQQPSFFTDPASDSDRVVSTKQVVSSSPSPFVSRSIAETVALVHRSSSFFTSKIY